MEMEKEVKAGDVWFGLKISEMGGKLEGTAGVTSSCLLNPGCCGILAYLSSLPEEEAMQYICWHCYAELKLKGYRANCRECYARNGGILNARMDDDALPRFVPGTYVRFESFGDLAGIEHLENFCRMAAKNPDCFFLLMTKRHEVVYAYIQEGGVIPDNLVLSGSAYKIGEMYSVGLPEEEERKIEQATLPGRGYISIHGAFEWLRTHGVYRHTFTVWSDEQIAAGIAPRINCGERHCKDCRACWSHCYSDRHERLK